MTHETDNLTKLRLPNIGANYKPSSQLQSERWFKMQQQLEIVNLQLLEDEKNYAMRLQDRDNGVTHEELIRKTRHRIQRLMETAYSYGYIFRCDGIGYYYLEMVEEGE